MQNSNCNLPYCPKHGIVSKRLDNDKDRRKNRALNKSSPVIINTDLIQAESPDASAISIINDELFINAFKQGKKIYTKTDTKIETIRGRSKSLSLSNIDFNIRRNLGSDIESDNIYDTDPNTECIMELHRKKYETIISSRPFIKRLLSN